MFRKKKKEEFKPTEPTEEMVKAIEVDSDMDNSEDEVPEIEPKKQPQRKQVYKEEMSKEELQKEQERLEQKIKEINEEEKQLRPKERIQVVKEIPTVPVRDYKAEDGSIVHLMTIEEYLTEQANLE